MSSAKDLISDDDLTPFVFNRSNARRSILDLIDMVRHAKAFIDFAYRRYSCMEDHAFM